MLIRRCAWHRQHFGYAVVLGVAEWRGPSVAYTDGICRSCAMLERRRLTGGDAATAAAARTMRRRALGRGLAVVVTTAAVAASITTGLTRHRQPALRASAPAVATVGVAGLGRPAGVTALAHAPEPSPPPRARPPRTSTPAPSTWRLDRHVTVPAPADRPQSFGQLARAMEISGRDRGRGWPAAERSRPSMTSAVPALPEVHAAFEPNLPPRETPVVIVALAVPPPASREERAEAP